VFNIEAHERRSTRMGAILIKQFGGLGGLVTGSCPIQFRSPDLFLGTPDRLEHPHAIGQLVTVALRLNYQKANRYGSLF